MLLNKTELSQKVFANVYTHNLSALTPGKIWVNSQNELMCSLGLKQKVKNI